MQELILVLLKSRLLDKKCIEKALEKAGAFENLKLRDEHEKEIESEPFGSKNKILRSTF